MVCEKFEFGIFHCPCSLLGVSDGRAISDEYRTQTVRFRSYWLPVLLTLLNWSTTMRPAEVVVKLFIRIANQVALLYNWFNERTHKIGEAVRLKNLKMRYCRPLGGIA